MTEDPAKAISCPTCGPRPDPAIIADAFETLTRLRKQVEIALQIVIDGQLRDNLGRRPESPGTFKVGDFIITDIKRLHP